MNNIAFNFAGKVVIVTGGASGIGMATVQMFARAGASVVLVDINQLGGEIITKELGKQVLFVRADVSNREHVDHAAKAALDAFGKINILVNCAGIEYNDRGNILEMPHDDLMRILEVNLFGYIHMARSCIPHIPRGGRIINVSSLQAFGAHLPGTSYQVSKAGILGLTHSLSIELAQRGITANTIAPGAISTEGMGKARSGQSGIDPYRRQIPLGRRGWPEEVAYTILFLASEEAGYITGTTLVVDGGQNINLTPPGESTPFSPNDPDR